MPKPLMNLDDVEFMDWGHGDRYQVRLGMISRKIGGEQLGYNLSEVPPGKRAFPRHNHHTNEEMFFVLEGEGELLVGEDCHPLRPGDVIACPAGGTETAHQIVNTSTSETLRYLAVSTTRSPEVVEYPDSGKVGVTIELEGSNEFGLPNMWRMMARQADAQVDYWEGEE